MRVVTAATSLAGEPLYPGPPQPEKTPRTKQQKEDR